MNFNDAAELAMSDTVERKIVKETRRCKYWDTYLATDRVTDWPTSWAIYRATRLAREAQYEALKEAQNEL